MNSSKFKMTTFNDQLFEKKLLALKDTQESISSLSSWCLQNPQHHKKIVSIWLNVLKRVQVEQRLSLFYLANDVIQYSKRKRYDFVESWGTALQRATTMVRDDKVKNKILRLFKIWDERSIYDEAFLCDLSGLLSSRAPAQNNTTDPAAEFQPTALFSKIRSCSKLEEDTDLKLKIVNESHLALSDADALRSSLKDRRHGEDVIAEVEEGLGRMSAYIKAMELEIKERTTLIDHLELADVFYDTQRGEAKVVCNAYRNFGGRVKSLKRKLDELIPDLLSPVPSPDINAPSPSPESDIELPNDEEDAELQTRLDMNMYTGDVTAMMGSFLGSGDPFVGSGALATSPPLLNHSMAATPTPVAAPTTGGGLPFLSNGTDTDVPHTTSFLSGATSFIGNLHLPFDLQRGMFSNEQSLDTPASPPPELLLDDSSHLGSFRSLSPEHLEEEELQGEEEEAKPKPIEVIGGTAGVTNNFNITEFIKSLMPGPSPPMKQELVALPVPAPTPVPPPASPSPPTPAAAAQLPLSSLDGNDDPWTPWETPVSPTPSYDQDAIDHVLSISPVSEDDDVDYRKKDIDHRNLISLTGSPATAPWQGVGSGGGRQPDDSPLWQGGRSGAGNGQPEDYMTSIPMPPTPPHPSINPPPPSNIESVDMEMSDDEVDLLLEKELGGRLGAAFGLNAASKRLVNDLPLKDREDVQRLARLQRHNLQRVPLVEDSKPIMPVDVPVEAPLPHLFVEDMECIPAPVGPPPSVSLNNLVPHHPPPPPPRFMAPPHQRPHVPWHHRPPPPPFRQHPPPYRLPPHHHADPYGDTGGRFRGDW